MLERVANGGMSPYRAAREIARGLASR
jgi:hypothetical protein